MKKGFTLVELLAVFAVLAIIALIAVPKINDYSEESKKSVFISSAKGILREVEYLNLDTYDFETSTLSSLGIKLSSKLYDLDNSVVYTLNDEIAINLVGKNKYKGLYLCGVTNNSIDIVQNSNCSSKIITVSFDYNGGTGNITTKQAVIGSTYGKLPIPTKEGYTFMGWNGKNMLNLEVPESLPSNTTNWDNSVKRTFTPNTFIKGMASNNYYVPTCIYYVNNNYNFIEYSASSGYGIAFPLLLEPSKQYTISHYFKYEQNNDEKNFSVRFSYYTNDGTFIKGDYEGPLNLGYHTLIKTIPSNAYYTLIIFMQSNNSNPNNIGEFSNIQLEEGSEATEYEPYYITNNTKVVQNKDHTLKAIWEPNS